MAASIVGSSHREQQRDCEDAIGYRVLETTSSLAIVVADGAGSVAHGRQGADAVVSALLVSLERLDHALATGSIDASDDALLHHCLRHLLLDGHIALLRRALDLNCPVRETSCTVAAVLVRDDLTLVAQVGDPGVTLIFTNGDAKLVIPPVRGEYVNQTVFISTWPVPGLENCTAVQRTPVKAVFAHTDGLNEVLYDNPFTTVTPAKRLLDKLAGGLAQSTPADDMDQQLQEYLQSPATLARSSDDLSLVVAYRPTSDLKVAVDEPAPPPPAVAPVADGEAPIGAAEGDSEEVVPADVEAPVSAQRPVAAPTAGPTSPPVRGRGPLRRFLSRLLPRRKLRR